LLKPYRNNPKFFNSYNQIEENYEFCQIKLTEKNFFKKLLGENFTQTIKLINELKNNLPNSLSTYIGIMDKFINNQLVKIIKEPNKILVNIVISELEIFVNDMYNYKYHLSFEGIQFLIKKIDLLKSLYEMTGEEEKVEKLNVMIEELKKEFE